MKKKHTAATTLCGALALAGSLFIGDAVQRSYAADNDALNGDVQQRLTSNRPVRPGVVTLRTSSDAPIIPERRPTVPLTEAEAARLRAVTETVALYLAAAKKDYSPRFGARTGAVREELVAALREYLRYADVPGRDEARALAMKIQIPALIQLAESSPITFRKRLAEASEVVSAYARSSKNNVEREKSLAVSIDYYLAVFRAASGAAGVDDIVVASDSAPAIASADSALPTIGDNPANSAEEDVEEELTEEEKEALEQEKQEYFNYYCDDLQEAVRAYFSGEGENSLDAIISALGEMRYYQSESPSVMRLSSYLHEVLSGNNFFLETSERFLSAFTFREVTESFDVNENIRGTQAHGAGLLRGQTYIDFKACETRAEMAIGLNANVSTRTVGENRGVFVHTDNLGSVVASKPMYFNPSGLITTSAATAQARMKTTVRGINTDRLTLLGGAIIQNKVNQELPASEHDSAERVKARVAAELDEQANSQILEMNRRAEHMEIGSPNSMIQKLSSRTSDDRFYLSCVLGRGLQLSVPETKMEENLNVLRGVGSGASYAVAEVADRSSLQALEGRRTPVLSALAPNLRNSSIMAVSSNTALPRLETIKNNLRLGSLDKKNADADAADLVVRFHQTAPNNAATIALAGAVFGPGYDSLDNVLFRFPGVDPDDVKKLLVPYEPQGGKGLDPEDHAQKIYLRFDEVQPFATHFENNTIATVLRVSSCDVDGTEWGPLEVRMTYRLERRGDSFVFVRDELEVLPGGYQDGDPVSARFYTFRRIFIKRLETTINDEYVFSPMPVDTIGALERRGALVPRKIEADNGWMRVEFELVSNYEPDNTTPRSGSNLTSGFAGFASRLAK